MTLSIRKDERLWAQLATTEREEILREFSGWKLKDLQGLYWKRKRSGWSGRDPEPIVFRA
jgi:hypothetical protein